ncbi:MAG: hypothetical protein JWQ23_2710, partial [Herminiimonas sp.]|nr:hypothetical protein [Herminiimonas sp.]
MPGKKQLVGNSFNKFIGDISGG